MKLKKHIKNTTNFEILESDWWKSIKVPLIKLNLINYLIYLDQIRLKSFEIKNKSTCDLTQSPHTARTLAQLVPM